MNNRERRIERLEETLGMKPGPRDIILTNVVNFDEEEETATIWTASGPMDRRLRKLGLAVIEEGDRHTVFKCLKSQAKIRRPKVLFADYKASLSSRMRLARQDQAITTAKRTSRGMPEGQGED